ncbi:hypothetical protein [Hymenobacter sp. CRA2]|uniref:hypothetical protein n=1 Tax=Hymenobacter sp. CRA2 TaxID=1955620 RepID=UPI00098EF145|nr:hypothetical protein [Hymenobacter sp. CRA2]OON70664.1 hypothetical protein B0919_01200 [Hymenobacter sp. CRA2]
MSWELLLHGVVILAGLFIVVIVMSAAIRSFVLPRNESVLINNWLFRAIRWVFDAIAARASTYGQRDRVLALYAPVALVALPIFWLWLLSVAYTGIFWGLDEGHVFRCYRISNSSLLTLGSEEPTHGVAATAFSYSEAGLGLLLLTLLISYLPTIYQSFSRRELVVARLELRAGSPSSATALTTWLHRSGHLHDDEPWMRWEEWFVEIEESHTSLPILSFFRSPQPGRSWVTTAGVILDTAALVFSAVEHARSPQMEVCFKAGCIALNRVQRFFEARAGSKPTDLVNVVNSGGTGQEEASRAEFEAAVEQLAKAGLALRPDQNAAWQQYCELRSRYQEALLFLARLTVSPELRSIKQS